MLALVAIALTTFSTPNLPSALVFAPPTTQVAETKSFVLTGAYRKETLDELYKAINARYVVPEIAKKIEADLRKRLETGEFDSIDNGAAFAQKINELMKAQVTDAHLKIRFSEKPFPVRKDPGQPSAEEVRRFEEQVRYDNAGFRKVERLRGNIGYIAFDRFTEPEDMKRPVAAAFEFLADTDALIIDLRSNGGGSAQGVQLFCSYLFDTKPVHLNSIYFREGNRTVDFWTLKKVDGPRYLNRDVYVLTSKRTGSGAEECSYNIQTQKRGTIVGEPTWGGANPGGVVRLNDHFFIFVPVGRAINPITKTNWEGVGVKPDVAEDPTKSLKATHLRIIRSLIAKASDPEKKTELEGVLKTVESEGN